MFEGFSVTSLHLFNIDRDVLSVNTDFDPVPVSFFFLPVQLKSATAKSSNGMIFKFLVLIQP